MITIKRIIHPVGQGGFCTETFCDHMATNAFTIVYDIGTFTGRGKKYIRNWLKDNRVDVVVLSHLHNDHINCLDLLLEKYPKVKIIIPQMTDEEILEAVIYNDNVMIGNMEIDTFFNQKNVVTIKKTTQREYAGFSSLMNIEEVEGKSQPALFQKDYFWKYFFYNPISKRDDLITGIKKSNTAISQIISNDKIDYVKLKEIFLDANLKGELKNIYGNIYKEHNSYSMCMYSGVDKEYKVSINSNCMKNQNSGCIYTGDIPLNSEEKIKSFCDYYKTEINDVGLIQIPHHGSKNNFNEKLLNIQNTDFFICSKEGFDNKCVVKNLEERKASFIKVTEKSEKKTYPISVTPVSNSFILRNIDKQFLTYYYECFISKLNEETGMHFFIPTVEQWEFGVLSSNIWSVKNSNTLDEKTVHAESNNSYDDKTQSKRGLFDMSGNLGELCRSSDEKSDVCYIKGGSYKSVRTRCRIDYTDVKFKHIPLKNVGVRLCHSKEDNEVKTNPEGETIT